MQINSFKLPWAFQRRICQDCSTSLPSSFAV